MLWCFREADGKLLWRLRSPYIAGLYNRSFGVCATPTVAGDRIYLLGHLGDVLCLSTTGLADGNRGPFQEEAQYFAIGRRAKYSLADDGRRTFEYTPGTPATLGPMDADILWKFDMLREVNCWPWNALNAAVLVRGDRVYAATCSTLCDRGDGDARDKIEAWQKQHGQPPADSPSLIVLDKDTGKLLATDREGIFEQTFHGAHASPALGAVNGKELLFYGGGNGTCYAFDPEFTPGRDGAPGELRLVWKFNCLDAASYGPGFGVERIKKAETIATPVFYKNRVYTAIGNDLARSGSAAGPGRLVCIDATKTGDISRTGRIWSFDEMRSTASTVAIAGGLLYTADASGAVYCLDAETGKLYWTHQTAPVWSSPLAADGKVFVGTHGRGLLVFAQGKQKKVLSEPKSSLDLVGSPAAANGVLYVVSQKHLYALQADKAGGLVGQGD
jgi:outer membrane protein assembly factor BamB